MCTRRCLALGIWLTVSLARADLLVTSAGNNSVLRFNSTTGAFVSAFVSSGSGGLSQPRGLSIGSTGDLFVSSFTTNSVLRYSGSTGAFVGSFVTPGSGGLAGPFDLAFGPDGNLYVNSSISDQILRYNGATGAFIDSFATGAIPALNTPRGMAFGNGNLFVSGEGDRIWRFNAATGNFQSSTLGDNPRGMTIGPDANLYVAFRVANLVARYNGTTGAPLGNFVTNPGNGGLLSPMGLAFGPDGNLYVAGSGNDAILRYSGTTGAFIDNYIPASSGGLSSPQFLIFTPQPIPEPSTAVCLGAGCVVLWLCGRRRARA